MGPLSALFKSRRSASHHPLPPALFPTGECAISVGAWASSIRDVAENRACRVRRIAHCKTKSGSRDEFLVVRVQHPSGKNAVVLADRDTSFGPSPLHADEDANIPPSYLHSGASARTLGIAPSRDRVLLSPVGIEASLARYTPGGWVEIHTVKFPKASEAPSVAHLAVLLTVAHRHVMPPGASAEVRSGWFAYCVAEVMREIFLGEAKANKQWVRIPYGGMKAENRDTVNTLIREFRPAWEDYSRRQPMGGGGRSTEYNLKQREEKKAQMDSLADMLRTANL